MTMTLNLPPELEQEVRAEAARTGLAADAVVISAVAERYQPKGPAPDASVLPQRQAELLTEINAGLPVEFWERYHTLRSQRQDPAFSDAARVELLSLIDRIEEVRVHRLEKLIELARLQGVPWKSLESRLQLTPLVPPSLADGDADE